MARIIDFEAHVQPPEYVKEVEQYDGYPKYGNDSRGRFTWYVTPKIFEVRDRLRDKLADVKTRLGEMERAGIEMQVLTLTFPNCEAYPADLGIKLARMSNDHIAQMIRQHPDHFTGLANLPLQDIEAALAELDRVKGSGIRGINIFSNVRGKYVDAEEYWPIYERAQKLRFPIFLHPGVPVNAETYEKYHLWGPPFGFGADATAATLRLMMSGVFEEYPNLKIVLGHLGEGIPYFVKRIDWAYLRTPEEVPKLKRKPSEYFLNNFFLDTAGVFHEPSLQCAYETMGAEKIVFGSDYPMENAAQGVEFVADSRISKGDKEKIFWKNAADLLQL